MGVGDALSGIFGGKNSYDYQFSPLMGSDEAIRAQNARLGQSATNAQNIKLPHNVLNFNANKGESAQQQALIDQILAQGRGEGPNPALQQLNLTTDQNARQGNALIASQRGINPALAARMGLQNTAQANQQAVGQGALMSAQQQLGAQQLGGNLLGQRIGQQSQNAIAQGQAGLGLLGARLGAEANRRQAQQNYQNMVNQAYNNANQVNAGVAAQNAQTAGTYGMGGMSGISSMLGGGSMFGFNEGGVVPEYLASGGTAGAYTAFQGESPYTSFLGSNLPTHSGVSQPTVGGKISSGLSNILSNIFKPTGGSYDRVMKEMDRPVAMSSATDPNTAQFYQPDAMYPTSPGSMMYKSDGGKVFGKAEVKGDSIENDTVPAMLSPGEVVIPRTAMKTPEDAHAFLDKIIQKHEGPSYKAIMQAKEHYHNMAHGGSMKECMYCGGMA